MNKQLILDVLLNVTFVSITIGFLFFTYGKYIEEKVVKKQAKQLVHELITEYSYLVPSEIKSQISNNLVSPDFTVQDNTVATSNKTLLLKAFYILSAIFIIGSFASYYISKKFNLDFLGSVKISTILTLFVALTEISFLTFIGQNYTSADPNFVKLSLLESLKENL